jgi:glutamyl/glutaminyl-tRNA synthetase
LVNISQKGLLWGILKDLVQGEVEIENNTIEDFVILRNDETPTYNLSASVDDQYFMF